MIGLGITVLILLSSETFSISTIGTCLICLYFIFTGILFVKWKYIYTDKYFVLCIFKSLKPLPFEDIVSISNEIVGIFFIRTKNGGIYYFPLLFQKKELKKLSEFIISVNNDCQITIK